ncbi:MAG: phosphatidylglycerophosphatase A [Gammaproteobacteria bacterium]|nr:phosphatidylglycerophosphatase A [Gammaproteobacteria bacterium]
MSLNLVKQVDLSNPVHLLAFGFGSGLLPKAPGTAGTGVAVLFYLPMAQLSMPAYSLLVLASAGVGVWICGRTSQDLGVHDHSGIVWDEFVGLWITLIMVPPGWLWIVLGFLLFRMLDVLKPWPIKWVDKHVSGGLGIMLDDILAGIMATLCIQAIVILTS